MTAKAFNHGLMWAGWRMFATNNIKLEDAYTGFVKLANEMSTKDPDAHLIMAFGA